MTISRPTSTDRLDAIGARPIPEFEGVHDVWPRGDRLQAVREAAAEYSVRFKCQGRGGIDHGVIRPAQR